MTSRQSTRAPPPPESPQTLRFPQDALSMQFLWTHGVKFRYDFIWFPLEIHQSAKKSCFHLFFQSFASWKRSLSISMYLWVNLGINTIPFNIYIYIYLITLAHFYMKKSDFQHIHIHISKSIPRKLWKHPSSAPFFHFQTLCFSLSTCFRPSCQFLPELLGIIPGIRWSVRNANFSCYFELY